MAFKLPVECILSKAKWTNSVTFARFYRRKVNTAPDMGTELLTGNVKNQKAFNRFGSNMYGSISRQFAIFPALPLTLRVMVTNVNNQRW